MCILFDLENSPSEVEISDCRKYYNNINVQYGVLGKYIKVPSTITLYIAIKINVGGRILLT